MHRSAWPPLVAAVMVFLAVAPHARAHSLEVKRVSTQIVLPAATEGPDGERNLSEKTAVARCPRGWHAVSGGWRTTRVFTSLYGVAGPRVTVRGSRVIARVFTGALESEGGPPPPIDIWGICLRDRTSRSRGHRHAVPAPRGVARSRALRPTAVSKLRLPCPRGTQATGLSHVHSNSAEPQGLLTRSPWPSRLRTALTWEVENFSSEPEPVRATPRCSAGTTARARGHTHKLRYRLARTAIKRLARGKVRRVTSTCPRRHAAVGLAWRAHGLFAFHGSNVRGRSASTDLGAGYGDGRSSVNAICLRTRL